MAPMRSRSFILLGPYWTADDSSLVKKSRWNTGGASLKYLAANLAERGGRIGQRGHGSRKRSERSDGFLRGSGLHSRLRIGTDAKELAEGHTQALVEVMVDPATGFDPLCVALQQIQNQRAQVSSDQQRVILFQQQLGHAL